MKQYTLNKHVILAVSLCLALSTSLNGSEGARSFLEKHRNKIVAGAVVLTAAVIGFSLLSRKAKTKHPSYDSSIPLDKSDQGLQTVQSKAAPQKSSNQSKRYYRASSHAAQAKLSTRAKRHRRKNTHSKRDNRLKPVDPRIEAIANDKQVEKGAIGDIKKTAFVSVVYRDSEGKIRMHAQKRARGMSYAGQIEPAGGHLTNGQTFRQGAVMELFQETGIRVDEEKLQVIGHNTNSKGEVCHIDFLAVLDQKPKTHTRSNEIDKKFGHQWLTVDDSLRSKVEKDHKQHNQNSREFYSTFRKHLHQVRRLAN